MCPARLSPWYLWAKGLGGAVEAVDLTTSRVGKYVSLERGFVVYACQHKLEGIQT